jgi:uncharacterized membrane protein YphA (DoxX/SURF4 family)
MACCNGVRLELEAVITQNNPLLDLIARLCLVVLFPFSAVNKIFDHQAAMAQAAHGWLPLPGWLAELLLVLGGLLEIIGPICILFGFYRRQAALLFIFYVIATAVLFHNFWSFPFNGDPWNQNFWPFQGESPPVRSFPRKRESSRIWAPGFAGTSG